jgi:hypothetical protein
MVCVCVCARKRERERSNKRQCTNVYLFVEIVQNFTVVTTKIHQIQNRSMVSYDALARDLKRINSALHLVVSFLYSSVLCCVTLTFF